MSLGVVTVARATGEIHIRYALLDRSHDWMTFGIATSERTIVENVLGLVATTVADGAIRPGDGTLAAMAAYRIAELARLTGVKPRTIRLYVELRLLPRPKFRGVATEYGREHLLKLLAIQRFKRDAGRERIPIPTIQARLAALSSADLAAFAPPAAAPPQAPPSEPSQVAEMPLAASPIITSSPLPTAERWERFVLVRGLELHVAAEASPLLRRLAAEIVERYSASA